MKSRESIQHPAAFTCLSSFLHCLAISSKQIKQLLTKNTVLNCVKSDECAYLL